MNILLRNFFWKLPKRYSACDTWAHDNKSSACRSRPAIVFMMAWLATSSYTILTLAQQNAPNPPSASTGQHEQLSDSFKIISMPINFSQERIDLTLAYRRTHQDPGATDILIQPKMIILHWTGINSVESTWKYFNSVRAQAARPEL